MCLPFGMRGTIFCWPNLLLQQRRCVWRSAFRELGGGQKEEEEQEEQEEEEEDAVEKQQQQDQQHRGGEVEQDAGQGSGRELAHW
jgi:hypothetical protein